MTCRHLTACPTVLVPSLSSLDNIYGSSYACVPALKRRKSENWRKAKKERSKEGKAQGKWGLMAWWCMLRSHLHWFHNVITISWLHNVNTIYWSSWKVDLILPWSWKAIAIAKLWTIPLPLPYFFSLGGAYLVVVGCMKTFVCSSERQRIWLFLLFWYVEINGSFAWKLKAELELI